jgi:Fe2+ or Zn2+ uptake regulation protein
LRKRAAAVDFDHLQGEGFEVRSHALSVFGLCPTCAENLRVSDS